MHPRLKIALAALAAFSLAVVAWVVLRPAEPVYRGRPLSQCLAPSLSNPERGTMNWAARNLVADEAVRHFGTNAVPTLLRMLESTDPSLKARLIDLGERRCGVFIKYVSAEERNDAGQRGFEVLGVEASNAVPALLRIARRNLSPASHSAAIAALGAIGPPARAAVPSLLQWATNDGTQAGAAIRALGRIRAEPSIVVPVLTNALLGPNVRPSVVFALGEFGTNALPAVPALVALLHSEADLTDKPIYTNALNKIDPRILSHE